MHYDRKVSQKLGDTVALRAMQKPQPERVGTTTQPTVAQQQPAATQPVQQPVQQPVTEPVSQPVEKPVEPSQPVAQKEEPAPQKPVETPKQEKQKPASKADTMEVNGIQVIVEKNEKPKQKQQEQPAQQPSQPAVQQPVQQQPAQPTQTSYQLPEKVNGLNVFVLDPYSVPFKSAYYPYTSRPVYENNKTKFILARAGDTYQKLAASLQMTEKNLRLYNDVYDGSEPIEDEVIYLEMKSTKSSVPYHTLQEGDTYRYIAQRYGIQLKILIKRNSGNINSYGVGDQICIGCN